MKIAGAFIPEEEHEPQEGYARGLPNTLYRFAVRSEMQRMQRSRTNQRNKSTLEHRAWAEWYRYFRRQLRNRIRGRISD